MRCRLVQGTLRSPSVSDGWKLELLDTLCLDVYFTCAQVRQITESIEYADSRVTAACRVFTRVLDPEDWREAEAALTPAQRDEIQSLLGVASVFNSKNPTGRYVLQLSYHVHYFTALRLLELYREQWANGLCSWPLRCCFTEYSHNGVDLDVREPHRMAMPASSGTLVIAFVDLRPVRQLEPVMHDATFRTLCSIALNSAVRSLASTDCTTRRCKGRVHLCALTTGPVCKVTMKCR